MLSDLRFAFRALRNQPSFVLVAVCSLAIGIGANTAVYSFADTLLLRPMPVWKPSQVVNVTQATNGSLGAATEASYPDYVDLRSHSGSFSGMVASALAPFGLAPDHNTQPRIRMSMFVSGNFFDVLRVTPQLGRGFAPREDEVPGRDAVVVLSHNLWTSDFASDPSIVGRKVVLNGVDFTVIGVTPEQFTSIGQIKPAMYVPMAMAARLWEPAMLTDRGRRWLDVRARLKPGVSLQQAGADVSRIAAALRKSYPATDSSLRLKVETELQLRAEQSPPDTALVIMLVLLALCVLLIACANVAGLLVSRSAGRAREIAVRLAIGGSRSALIRQLLIENLYVAIAGGSVGLLIGLGATRFFNSLPMPTDLPLDLNFRLDDRALLFTFAVSLMSTLLFGLVPALRSTKLDLNSALKEKAATSSKKMRFWGRRVMVSAQVALSLVLLVLTAVLVRGFRAELEHGPGFRVDGLQLMSVDTGVVHDSDAQRDRFFHDVEQSARMLPGIRNVTLAKNVPLGYSNSTIDATPEGYEVKKGETAPSIANDVVTPGFFDVFGVPIVKGRGFSEHDTASSPAVAVVNEHFAQHYWPNQDPIGKRVRLQGFPGKEAQVVGVAKTTKYFWITEPPFDFIYLPLAQSPNSGMTLIAESAGPDPASLFPELRELVRRLDPNMPISDVRTMRSLFNDRAVTTPRYIVKIVGAMGLLALVLSCVGLYGLVSYGASRRVREFGIRVALGAQRAQVARLVLSECIWMAVAGGAAGLVLGALASSGLQSQILFTFQPIGWAPYAVVCLILVATVCLAGYGPAHRASKTDPVRALREE